MFCPTDAKLFPFNDQDALSHSVRIDVFDICTDSDDEIMMKMNERRREGNIRGGEIGMNCQKCRFKNGFCVFIMYWRKICGSGMVMEYYRRASNTDDDFGGVRPVMERNSILFNLFFC